MIHIIKRPSAIYSVLLLIITRHVLANMSDVIFQHSQSYATLFDRRCTNNVRGLPGDLRIRESVLSLSHKFT